MKRGQLGTKPNESLSDSRKPKKTDRRGRSRNQRDNKKVIISGLRTGLEDKRMLVGKGTHGDIEVFSTATTGGESPTPGVVEQTETNSVKNKARKVIHQRKKNSGLRFGWGGEGKNKALVKEKLGKMTGMDKHRQNT